jgi:hypothetical protein
MFDFFLREQVELAEEVSLAVVPLAVAVVR